MDQIVKDWIANVRVKAKGRTRYEGQEPYADEAVVAYIDEIQRNLAHAEQEWARAERKFAKLVDERDEARTEIDRLRMVADMRKRVARKAWEALKKAKGAIKSSGSSRVLYDYERAAVDVIDAALAGQGKDHEPQEEAAQDTGPGKQDP